jgi:hypothetical protein
MALLAAPGVLHAATQDAGVAGRESDASSSLSQTRFDLHPGSGPEEIVVTGNRQRAFAPESRRNLAATGARYGDGEIQYIGGPVWDYRTSRRGPLIEVAALGGGMESAPYLAHVAVNWQF